MGCGWEEWYWYDILKLRVRFVHSSVRLTCFDMIIVSVDAYFHFSSSEDA
jgi:hypothetical protein